ncbi:MAG: hypothetical protein ACI97A_000151 [Planctomycetota bacterium]|jgi:hypothetical protein
MLRFLPFFLLCSSLCAQTWPEEVNFAIDRGIQHLLTYQKENGAFHARHAGGYPTGETALATYALVKSGLVLGDPAVEKAINYLIKNEKFERTYNVATFILALDALGTKQYDSHIQKAGAWIEKTIDRETDLWTYPVSPSNKVDLSNTQFALLGLSVARKHGLKVSRSLWMKVLDAVAESQNEDGGFGYRGDLRPHSSGAMTTAGLTIVHLIEKELGKKKTPRVIQDVKDRAWAWLDKVFTVRGNPSRANGVVEHEYPFSKTHPYYNLYYLYGLERIAAFNSRKEIGGRDWYREGALFLLSQQKSNGSWKNIDNTAFALLFLRRATFSGLAGRNPLAGDSGPIKWQCSFAETAPSDWFKPSFDDGPWQSASGSFGTRNSTNGAIRTTWNGPHIRIRRTFSLVEEDIKNFNLYVQHDDDCSIWINGIKAAEMGYFSTDYITPTLSPEARASLKKGENLLAVHCRNPAGAGIVDVQIVDVGMRTKRKDLLPEERAKLWWRNPPYDGVPFIERWAVLGPLRDPDDALLFESLLPDEKAAAKPGTSGKKGKWRELWTRGGFVDFGATLKVKDKSIYYAFTWLEAKRDTKAVLRFGGDDGYQIFFDGKLLVSHHGIRAAKADEVSLPIILRKGMHRLLVKVGNGTGASGFYLRITDREGKSPRDIRPRLKPKGADLEAEARAHPDFFSAKELFGQLEPDDSPKLDFRVAKQLKRLTITGSPIGFPQWQSKSSKSPFPSPPPGGRGMAGFRWYENTPTRIFRILNLPNGKPRLTARVAFSPPVLTTKAATSIGKKPKPPTKDYDPKAKVRIRIGVWRRNIRWLVDRELSVSTDPKKIWLKLNALLSSFGGQEVLLVIELSGTPGGTLWFDDLTLKNR